MDMGSFPAVLLKASLALFLASIVYLWLFTKDSRIKRMVKRHCGVRLRSEFGKPAEGIMHFFTGKPFTERPYEGEYHRLDLHTFARRGWMMVGRMRIDFPYERLGVLEVQTSHGDGRWVKENDRPSLYFLWSARNGWRLETLRDNGDRIDAGILNVGRLILVDRTSQWLVIDQSEDPEHTLREIVRIAEAYRSVDAYRSGLAMEVMRTENGLNPEERARIMEEIISGPLLNQGHRPKIQEEVERIRGRAKAQADHRASNGN